MTHSITIIGAGIGGLTTALVLKQKGYKVRVYESAVKINPVGAGIVLASNAMQIFRELGVYEEIENAGYRISSMVIANEKLHPLSSVKLTEFEKRYGVYNIGIHRADLQKILAEKVGYDNIVLAKRLTKIEQSKAVKLTFDDNTVVNAGIVIAADGIHSTVRNQLFESSKIRDTGQVCWRGVLETGLVEKYSNEAVEAWGKGRRLGVVRIGTRNLYWFAVANEGLVENKNLSGLLEDFHPDIQEIISRTPQEKILQNKLTDLKPISKWHVGNVCLLGDAAHASTPNLGQGACQAVEDAYAIGKILKPEKPIEDSLAEYEKLRIKKANNIVNKSWNMGKITNVENSLGVWLRNQFTRMMPARTTTKQLQEIFDIEYLIKA